MVNETFQKVLKLQSGGSTYTSEGLPLSVQQKEVQLDPANYGMGQSAAGGQAPGAAAASKAPSLDMTEIFKAKGDESDMRYLTSKIQAMQSDIQSEMVKNPEFGATRRGQDKFNELAATVQNGPSMLYTRAEVRKDGFEEAKKNDAIGKYAMSGDNFLASTKGGDYVPVSYTDYIKNRGAYNLIKIDDLNNRAISDINLSGSSYGKESILGFMKNVRSGKALTDEVVTALAGIGITENGGTFFKNGENGANMAVFTGDEIINTIHSKQGSNNSQLRAVLNNLMTGKGLSDQAKAGLTQDAAIEVSHAFDGSGKVIKELQDQNLTMTNPNTNKAITIKYKDLDKDDNLKNEFIRQKIDEYKLNNLSKAIAHRATSSSDMTQSLSNTAEHNASQKVGDLELSALMLGKRDIIKDNGFTAPFSIMAYPSADKEGKTSRFIDSQIGSAVDQQSIRIQGIGDNTTQQQIDDILHKGVARKVGFSTSITDANGVPLDMQGKEFDIARAAIQKYQPRYDALIAESQKTTKNSPEWATIQSRIKNLNSSTTKELQEKVPENMKQKVHLQQVMTAWVDVPADRTFLGTNATFHDATDAYGGADRPNYEKAMGMKPGDFTNKLVTVKIKAVTYLSDNTAPLAGGEKVNLKNADNGAKPWGKPSYEGNAMDMYSNGISNPSGQGQSHAKGGKLLSLNDIQNDNE
jgi:hypothetical protein